MNPFWDDEASHQALPFVIVDGAEIGPGSRVRIHPQPGGDVFDLVLAGKVGIVERIEQDLEDNILVAVTVEDDPGRDLGEALQPGHRFFYAPAELEPVIPPGEPAP